MLQSKKLADIRSDCPPAATCAPASRVKGAVMRGPLCKLPLRTHECHGECACVSVSLRLSPIVCHGGCELACVRACVRARVCV